MSETEIAVAIAAINPDGVIQEMFVPKAEDRGLRYVEKSILEWVEPVAFDRLRTRLKQAKRLNGYWVDWRENGKITPCKGDFSLAGDGYIWSRITEFLPSQPDNKNVPGIYTRMDTDLLSQVRSRLGLDDTCQVQLNLDSLDDKGWIDVNLTCDSKEQVQQVMANQKKLAEVACGLGVRYLHVMLRDEKRYQIDSQLIKNSPGLYFMSNQGVSANNVSTLPIESMHSNWLKSDPTHQRIFNAYQNAVAAYLYSAEPGHRILAVRVNLSPDRLNKPIEKMLRDGGQPLMILDDEIALPRAQAISDAIAQDEMVIKPYSHYWQGNTWHFTNTAIPLGDEILVVVNDAANWQQSWWENRISS